MFTPMQFSFGVNFPTPSQGGEGGGSSQLSAESSPEISATSLDVNGVITVTTWPTWNLPGVTTTVEFDYFNGSQWTNLGSFPGDALVLTVDLIATSVRARVTGHLNGQSASTTSNESSTNTARAPSIANNYAWVPLITHDQIHQAEGIHLNVFKTLWSSVPPSELPIDFGNPPGSAVWHWYKNSVLDTNALGYSNYNLLYDDAGATISVSFRVINPSGEDARSSAPVIVNELANPSADVGPEITLSGLVGTCSPGTWIGNPTPLEAPLSVTPTYQWQSDASGSFLDISGATTPTLSIGYNLSVRCQVTVFDYSNIAHSAYSNTIFIPET